MTTELPSGETFTAGKLTELKNSSMVSLGFAVWPWARIEVVKIEAKTADTRETSSTFRCLEDGSMEFSITVFKNEVYTARAVARNVPVGQSPRASSLFNLNSPDFVIPSEAKDDNP